MLLHFLLNPVQLILNTAEGSHHVVVDIKPHEVWCPWSVDAIQGSQKCCWRSVPPIPHWSTSTTTCSDTPDV